MRLSSLLYILTIFIFSACSTSQVNQADLDSWKGQPVEALDEHPFFSAVDHSEKKLTSGKVVRTYSNCHPQDKAICCHNQFLINKDKVQRYTTVGQCFTDGTLRPGYAGPVKLFKVDKKKKFLNDFEQGFANGLKGAGSRSPASNRDANGFSKKCSSNRDCSYPQLCVKPPNSYSVHGYCAKSAD